MTRDEERAIIEKGRPIWAEASAEVADRVTGNEHLLEGRIIPQAPLGPIAIFHPEADYRDVAFYTMAHQLVAALYQSRDRLIAYYNRMNPPATEAQQEEKKRFSYAQNCGIYCGKPLFQKFMFERHGLDHPRDKNRMATKLHSLLTIKSRTELDTEEAARDRWISLRGEFEAWKEARL